MTTDVLLFVLRLISAALLLVLLGALFVVLWRDTRSAAAQAESVKRSHGRLIMMQDIDGVITPTAQIYPLLPLTSLGRSPTNTIPVDDTFASSEHALIALRNGTWWLEDRQSRNGSTLNGLPITEPVIVTDGDILGIGSARVKIELE